MDDEPKRILVVEDSPGARVLAVRMLTSLGYTVVAAKDATEAVAILDKDQNFDLLFTDVIMPGNTDGLALARIVRERKLVMQIVFTSGFSALDPNELTDLDATYVAKPYRKTEITFLLRSLLKP